MEERILSLRKLLDLSQKEFASRISITQAALSQIESGKTTLSISTVYNLIKAFELRADWLLFGQGEIFTHQKIDIALGTPPKSQHKFDHLISFVDKDAEAGYPDNCSDHEYIKTLGAYRIPGFEEGTFRMFNISGDSMQPKLYDDEVVITQVVEKIENIRDNRMCVVVSKAGIVAKRVFQDGNDVLLLKSENPKYKDYKLAYSDIMEVWEIKSKISSVFLKDEAATGNDYLINQRLEELEKTVEILKSAFIDGKANNNNHGEDSVMDKNKDR